MMFDQNNPIAFVLVFPKCRAEQRSLAEPYITKPVDQRRVAQAILYLIKGKLAIKIKDNPHHIAPCPVVSGMAVEHQMKTIGPGQNYFFWKSCII